jgi:hypothetical protein
MMAVARAMLVVGLIMVSTTAVSADDSSTEVTSPTDEPDDEESDRPQITAEVQQRADRPSPQESAGMDVTPETAPENAGGPQIHPQYHDPSILPIHGKAMYYNAGVMQTVLDNRLRSGRVQECAECIGYVALLRSGDLNRKVWIQRSDGPIEGPFHVIDVADVKHVPMLLEKQWAVDVDYDTAIRWGMNGPIWVTVLDSPTPGEAALVPEQVPDSPPAAPVFTIDLYRSARTGCPTEVGGYFGSVEELYVN